MEEKNIHEEHRKRMQQRVAQYGLESLPEHEALEYLLFFTIARRNTNPIAHALLERFGTYCQVLEAPEVELAQVPGMGPASARFLHSLLPANRYYQQQKQKKIRSLNSEQEYIDYFRPFFYGQTNERFYAVVLDDKNRILRCEMLGEGLPNSVEIPVRKIASTALLAGGTGILLAHNHPSGEAAPSEQDVIATGRVAKALGILSIDLLDHVIIAGEEGCTMHQFHRLPIYDPIRCEVEYI